MARLKTARLPLRSDRTPSSSDVSKPKTARLPLPSDRETNPRYLRIFLASPGDVIEEREIVGLLAAELQRTIAFRNDVQLIHLELVRWETHTWPDIGADAQDVINRQIGPYDVFVGIMWRRFGTPTHRAESGTEEEFDRAYSLHKLFRRPKIMFYFKTEEFYAQTLQELDQFAKVLTFKNRLSDAGALYWQYKTSLEFERLLREHLVKQLLTLVEELGRSS